MRILCCLFVAACSPVTSTPVPQQPPPGDLEVQLPSLITETAVNVTATGAQVSEEIILKGSISGPGTDCPAAYGGQCLSMANPITLGRGWSDANGVATIELTPPTSILGRTVCVQAVIVRGPAGADTEISPVQCGVVVDSCGPEAWSVDFDGYTTGRHRVLRLPKATLVSDAYLWTQPGLLGVEGPFGSDVLVEPDEAVTILFDKPTTDVMIEMTDTTSASSIQAYDAFGHLIGPAYTLPGRFHDVSNAVDDVPISALVVSANSTGKAITAISGTTSNCDCEPRQAKADFRLPGSGTLDQLVRPGMTVTAAGQIGFDSFGGLGVALSGFPDDVDADEAVHIAFAPPITDLTYLVGGSGGSGNQNGDRLVELYGEQGQILGSRIESSVGQFEVASVPGVGNTPISAMVLSGTGGRFSLYSVTRTDCR